MKSRNRKAFTLIELIIVIVVLGILAAIAIVGYRSLIDRTQSSSVETSARDFDARLRQTAAAGSAKYTINGNDGDITDTDPRKSVYLLEMLEGAVVPDQSVASDKLSGGSLRVLVYNAGGGSGDWTRLTCGTATSQPCPDNPDVNEYDNTDTTWIQDGTDGLLPGQYASAFNTGEILCIQFHKSGKDIFMGWPGAYPNATGVEPTSSTKAVVSEDIDKACDGADGLITSPADANITPVTAAADGSAKYFDLQSAEVTDTSWGS